MCKKVSSGLIACGRALESWPYLEGIKPAMHLQQPCRTVPSREPSKVKANAQISSNLISNHRHATLGSSLPRGDLMAFTFWKQLLIELGFWKTVAERTQLRTEQWLLRCWESPWPNRADSSSARCSIGGEWGMLQWCAMPVESMLCRQDT